MSRSQTLRALVNERLAAAAEEIFVLIERTIVEYEEELSRSKEENQRKQQLLDKVLYPRIVQVRGNVQIPTSPGPGLNQEITETQKIKEEPEEQSVKQEEEQLPEPVPESSAVCVKTEESSLLQQRQTEHREETQGEDISSETHFHSETEGQTEHREETQGEDISSETHFHSETEGHAEHREETQGEDISSETHFHSETEGHAEHREETQGEDISSETHFHSETEGQTEHWSDTDDDDWESHCCSAAQMETEADGDHDNQVQSRDRSTKLSPQNTSAPETTVHSGHVLEAKRKKHQCHLCQKRFGAKHHLQRHTRVHTGEKPYSCSVCKQYFAQPFSLRRHNRKHTGERPYSCTICEKTFNRKDHLRKHMRTHTTS